MERKLLTKRGRALYKKRGVRWSHDHNDSTSIPYTVPDYTNALTGDISGLRIGVPREYFAQGIG